MGGIILLIISYAFIGLGIYGTIIINDNNGFIGDFADFDKLIDSWENISVEYFEGLTANLTLAAIVVLAATLLAILFGSLANRKLKRVRKDNVFLMMMYVISWIPYLPFWVVALPFRLLGFIFHNDIGNIISFIISYLSLIAAIYFVIILNNAGLFTETISPTVKGLIFDFEFDSEAALTTLIVTSALYIVFTTITHFKLRDIYDESKLFGVLNVLNWIIFIPIVILFLPISLIVWVALSDGGTVEQSSSSGGYSGGYDGYGGSGSSNSYADYDYTVMDGSSTRYLKFFDNRSDVDSDSPYFGRSYGRYRDDLGNYWRSYDGGYSFIKETFEQTSRGW